jgi:tetratricopeptide (TPR) repeat protein
VSNSGSADQQPSSGFGRGSGGRRDEPAERAPATGYEEVTASIGEPPPDEPVPATAPPDDEPDRSTEPDRNTELNRSTGPELPDDVEFSALDPDARRELRSLSKTVAEIVGRHLVAAGLLIDEDPALALEHARYARIRASRVAVVREAAGLAAYHAGEFAEALGELRAVRRMTGTKAHLPVMVDCERALGRPERALELAAEAGTDLPADIAVELKIVVAGARRDLGQLDAAVVALQGPDLEPSRRDPWSARLFYAYADNLEAAGRIDDAIRWFLNAAEADDENETDAAERATDLSVP